ncbi:hypothetical protein A2313_02215 [Candidatus Roizmanbacteria bacterium RIFOXYB2_FULL_41_10]|uniref:Uncharacterized protein n=1 Tax=Candidatus Roizmanbacteria bacterium RIFOXYA1_FULL_41_12 TaxID=1802082 RepID=A0A1F7KAT2_9BACT|nr:MAG: hypothetical protein A2209_04725 [Candidatus Roizmanbacteria bacterium RIFOXYA1_FULL_41_12]OGK66770.1 MAG: hypothetical protein A2377_02595 [Candidatus Roizmanbacteria bacterium RIFOXYB1_FULL_41_27]OGK71898.1 MAG: hypothetical protein A2313_02215 [Candidatus Roizmanbacteria bacterium RIFOXYB2_FULL_41_10]OGK75565.1 MAG: hypothetical protein A2575_02590 [Candidatus Roizmanbacteria bacterium RIFOXYD1_FULL_41_24]
MATHKRLNLLVKAQKLYVWIWQRHTTPEPGMESYFTLKFFLNAILTLIMAQLQEVWIPKTTSVILLKQQKKQLIH